MSKLIRSPARGRQQNGVALVAVLWIVAALSLMVTGLSQTVRSEIRTVSAARQAVEASAIARAATQLALQQVKLLPQPLVKVTEVEIAYEGVVVRVELMPLNGLIDINNAPAPLLSLLYAVAGPMDRARADAMAQATLDARTAKDSQGRNLNFESVEELLRVPGLDYPLYARLVPFVTADLRGTGRVNALAAPPHVLAVLAEGDVAKAMAFLGQRESGQPNPDITMLNGQYLENSSTSQLQIQARVLLQNGDHVVRTSTINLTEDPLQGLPWRIFDSRQRTETAPPGPAR